ncbi:MAG TPA: MFS transporter [Desulfobacteraceae bacterium]|nr:MFS transporter [Desulfobacteraceae bacterium]
MKHENGTVTAEALPFSTAFPALLLMTALFYVNFMARISLAPLLPAIEHDLGFSHGESGALFLLVSAGYFITVIFSGCISSRIKHRGTIIFSALFLGLILLGIALSSSLLVLRAGMFLVGASAGFYLPSGIATLTSLINARDWGKAIAIHELAPNLGFVTVPIVCEILLIQLSWRGIIGLLGIISIAIGIAFIFLGKGGNFYGQAPSLAASRTLFSVPAFWIMVALFGLGITGSLGIFSMLPLYLVAERGIEREWANTLIAFSRLSGLFMAFVSGWVNDRLGPRKTLVGVMGFSGLSTLCLAVVPEKLLVVLLFVQPAAAVCFFPPAFTALARVGPPATRNISVSYTVPLGFLFGGGLAPIAIGTMGDIWSFSLGIGLFGLLILCGIMLAARLKLSSPETKPENR